MSVCECVCSIWWTKVAIFVCFLYAIISLFTTCVQLHEDIVQQRNGDHTCIVVSGCISWRDGTDCHTTWVWLVLFLPLCTSHPHHQTSLCGTHQHYPSHSAGHLSVCQCYQLPPWCLWTQHVNCGLWLLCNWRPADYSPKQQQTLVRWWQAASL